MCRFITIAVVTCATFAQPPKCLAGLYHRDTIGAYDIDEHGFAKAPEIDIFLTMVNIIKKTDNPNGDEALKMIRSIREREKKIASLSPEERVFLWIDMLRLRTDRELRANALNELQKLRIAPDGVEFLVYTHLAHIHMQNLSYQEAASAEDSAVADFPFPKRLLGLSPAQLSWYRRLEKDYYLPFLRHRNEETLRSKGKPVDELDPIFPGRTPGKKTAPVRFVGESGASQAGSIAAVERAKLPPDAIAIVQQMILWSPDDGRLWWQLAELYNAAGDLKSAAHVFKLCEEETEYRQRRIRELREHRDMVLAARQVQIDEEQRAKEAEEEKQRQALQAEDARKRQTATEEKRKMLMVVAGAAAVLFFVGYWQLREFARRFRARRARAEQQTIKAD